MQIVALVNPNMELVSAHKAQASEGLKNPADAQQFSVELREAADPMSADVGLERIYLGSAGPKFVCGDEWDFVWLVRYASP